MTLALSREGANCREQRVGFRGTGGGLRSARTREQPFLQLQLARCQARAAALLPRRLSSGLQD